MGNNQQHPLPQQDYIKSTMASEIGTGSQRQEEFHDKSVMKVSAFTAPKGAMGQKYLASGVHLSMRMWEDEQPGEQKETRREYETLGYVLKGRAELLLEGQKLILEPGDSWLVPKNASHAYKILETFSAVETTCPPAFAKGRDIKC